MRSLRAVAGFTFLAFKINTDNQNNYNGYKSNLKVGGEKKSGKRTGKIKVKIQLIHTLN
jgi:hypothetical protein